MMTRSLSSSNSLGQFFGWLDVEVGGQFFERVHDHGHRQFGFGLAVALAYQIVNQQSAPRFIKAEDRQQIAAAGCRWLRRCRWVYRLSLLPRRSSASNS